MNLRTLYTALALLLIAAIPTLSCAGEPDGPTAAVEHRDDIGRTQPGPHKGGGQTTGHPFFESFDDLGFAFRIRVLHPGSTIGYHEHDKDEIYYVLEGTGELTLNGEVSTVGPGTAILVRPGGSHGIKPTGDEDLVLLIVFERKRG